jgi:POT family proton-dependent oligopeptide transporter
MAVGYYILATQVKGLANTAKIGVIWLGVMYLFHTMGELCLSPIGLSLVAKLAPKRFSSLLMGVWFLANAAGYALCGTLGALLPNTGPKFLEAEKAGINLQAILDKTIVATPEQLAQLKSMNIRPDYPAFAGFTIHNLYEFVMMFVLLPAIAGVLLLSISPLLKKMMHGVR